jgi:hypothetical protein
MTDVQIDWTRLAVTTGTPAETLAALYGCGEVSVHTVARIVTELGVTISDVLTYRV